MSLTHEHSKSNHKYTVGYNPATKPSAIRGPNVYLLQSTAENRPC